MDAEASSGAVNVNNIELYYLKFSDSEFPTPYKQQRGSVIKYTKIPDYDFESRASWGRNNYTLPPRLRRIISLDDPALQSTRSVKATVAEHRPPTARNQRKIVPITEVEETDRMAPRSGRTSERGSPARSNRPGLQCHRAIQVSVYKDSAVGNTVSKIPSKNSSRYSDSSAKLIKSNKSDMNLSRVNSKGKYSPARSPLNLDNVKSRYLDDAKESPRRSKTSAYTKTSISNRIVRQNSDDRIQSKYKASESQKPTVTIKRSPEGRPATKYSALSSPTVEESPEETRYPASVIHVPIEQKYAKKNQNAPPKNAPRRRLLVSQPTHTQPPHTALDITSRHTPNTTGTHGFKSRCSETDDSIIDEDVDLAVSSSDQIPDSCVSVRKVDRRELTCSVSERREQVQRKELASSMSDRREPMDRRDMDIRGLMRWNDAIVVPIDPLYSDQAIDATLAAAPTVERSTSTTNTEPLTECCEYTEKTVGVTVFDDLQIPDLTLSKGEPNYVHETLSLPNLQMPDLKMTSMKVAASEGRGPLKVAPEKGPSTLPDSTSYIIGTLMYTTKQKINIQVVSDKSSTKTLGPVPSFPLSVVSVFKKDLKNYQDESSARSSQISNKCSLTLDKCLLKCDAASSLRKPSEIISSITVNQSLLKTDFVSEQFNRELNFIDSFFESLQYLESCSAHDQTAGAGQEKWLQSLEMDHSEYNNFLSKLEDGAVEDKSDTIMSRSLCLLNLLIRDEQRRAKDLLFVLKMREDALKDYTKSQIIWLENKKKQDNTDISQLKKKQRGALLKLQYECGEMQRMRKALLALSEKRKTALMKTKKNIELKLTSDVDVDKILSKKKQLRRSSSSERTIPVKCFELSSSTEEMLRPTKSEEKEDSSETHESSMEAVVSYLNETTPTQTSEKCVAVDGKYLNIVFNDLAMPQIFRSGKQYEVNEEALHNILNSKPKAPQVECIDQFVEHVQKQEDKSTSPSTARSLVEEFNQYYKDFAVGEKDSTTSPEDMMISDCTNTDTLFVVKPPQRPATISASISATEFTDPLSSETIDVPVMTSVETTMRLEKVEKDVNETQTGPLPVPAGVEAEKPEAQTQAESQEWPLAISATSISEESSEDSIRPSSQPAYSERSSLTALAPLTSPVDCEAERLRLQQIAIEREIKALERQQQCQMLVVRSIPDKPPPPYCAPAEAPRRAFAPDAATESLVSQYMTGTAPPPEDAFGAFVADFCSEKAPSNPEIESDKPWDACNQLPRPASPAMTTIIKGACEDLKSVLGTVPPTQVSGLANRRSDHIDDILFAEWRCCEPEWAALHLDEAIVKNQLFESIFQKVLTDTIDEYKVKVLGPEHDEG